MQPQRISKPAIQPDELFVVTKNGRRERAIERCCVICDTPFLVGIARSRDPNRGKTCSVQCGQKLRTSKSWAKTDRAYYKYVTIHGHPLANTQGNVPIHRLTLYEAIGPGTHPCHWCGKSVVWSSGRGNRGTLHVDHIDNDRLNNARENLVPSCERCNKRRGDPRNIQGDELFIPTQDGQRTRAVERICEVCSARFLVEIARLRRPGTGRACSRQCANALISREWRIKGRTSATE